MCNAGDCVWWPQGKALPHRPFSALAQPMRALQFPTCCLCSCSRYTYRIRVSGKQLHTRLTCTACKGTGHVTVVGPTARCPECNDSGKMQGSDLPCTVCRGAGLIAEKATETGTAAVQER